MGCAPSIFDDDDDKNKNKLRGHYVPAPKEKRAPKRRFFPQISNGSSSGFSSACTSPSRSSLSNRYNSSPSSLQMKLKTKILNSKSKNIPSPSKIMTICDDFHEAVNIQIHRENKSLGYYSESLSTESNVSTQYQSYQRIKTQGVSTRQESKYVTVTPTPSSMEMEMYMMSRGHRMSLKTSSPIFQRRDVTYDDVSAASPSSHSYQKWSKYLQTTPTFMLHNVTDIPEAIAGHFSPLNFPAFTELEEMESAAKRFKVDIHQKQMLRQPISIPILTTDL